MGDPDLWFPEHGRSPADAIRVCGMCDANQQCLDYALRSPTPLIGIWGGTSETQRKKMRRRLGIRNAPRIDHGTANGARHHYRLGEKPCPACARAAYIARMVM
jgi:WhiB family redox-sensing transcriptional regulator